MAINFKKSPLNEVILGIQLKGPSLSSKKSIELIDLLRNEYPEISEHPPIPSIIEHPNKPSTQKVLNSFASRKHLVHKNTNKLIQIQPDRLLFNWRREETNTPYPSFINVFHDFKEIINIIIKTVDFDLYKEINQFEFTYIDHIYLDTFGISSYRLDHFLNIFQYDSSIKSINLDYSIPHEKIGGTLNTSIKSAKNKKDERKLFVLENTCRGFIDSINIDTWFKYAHDILIHNFIYIINDRAKNTWKYEEK